MNKKNIDQRTFEFAAFVNSRVVRKMSPETVKWYKEKLDAFESYLESISFDGSIEEITPAIINGYLGSVGESCSAGTVHMAYRTVKTFLRWYDREVEPTWRNPILRVDPPVYKINPLPGINKSDFEALLGACGSGFYGKRDRAIVRALFDTGVRRSEFFSLTIADIEFDTGLITVTKTKNHKPRPVFLGPEAKRDMMRYIREHPNKSNRSAPLWVTQSGTKLTISGLRQIIRRLSDRAHIQEPGFHDFRRAFALQSRRNGMGELELKSIMGHSSLAVLQRYLDTDDEDLRLAHERSRPGW